MSDLFGQITRDERQEQCIQRWINNKCLGTLECCTSFGKTRCAIKCIQRLRAKLPEASVLIVVPTELLQKQWKEELDKFGLSINTEVQVINTAIKHSWNCTLLILDDVNFVQYKST